MKCIVYDFSCSTTSSNSKLRYTQTYIYILLYYYYNGIGKSSSYNMRILVPGKSRAGYHAFRVFYMTMIVLWDQKRLKNRLEDYGDSI